MIFTKRSFVWILLLSVANTSSGWLSSVQLITQRRSLSSSFFRRQSSSIRSRKQQIVDAEFERVTDVSDKPSAIKEDYNSDNDDDNKNNQKTLLEMYQDPDLENLRIPFADGEHVIDVKLGFMVDLDGVQYGIGVPFDYSAAITIEHKTGKVENVSPDLDNDEHSELMELMAERLQENVGDDLRLIKSPRVLTISGPLDKYTAKWKEEILPKSLGVDDLLNTDDEDIDSFLDFMKEELGEEEFTKTMNEEHTFDGEVMTLFSAPGMGDSDPKDLEEFLKKELENIDNLSSTPGSNEDLFKESQERELLSVFGTAMDHDGVALKLVSYGMPDGKKYSLVKLEKPVVLVAKQVGSEKAPQFELLANEEMKLVSPRLEQVCREDLEMIGVDFNEE